MTPRRLSPSHSHHGCGNLWALRFTSKKVKPSLNLQPTISTSALSRIESGESGTNGYTDQLARLLPYANIRIGWPTLAESSSMQVPAMPKGVLVNDTSLYWTHFANTWKTRGLIRRPKRFKMLPSSWQGLPCGTR